MKSTLIENGILLKDGYDFEGATFNINSISIKSSKKNMIALRFINHEDELNQLLELNQNTSKVVYQFYQTKPVEYMHKLREIKIEIKTINEIKNIIE